MFDSKMLPLKLVLGLAVFLLSRASYQGTKETEIFLYQVLQYTKNIRRCFIYQNEKAQMHTHNIVTNYLINRGLGGYNKFHP